ncbi:MAG: hypothetical protein WB626_03390 [Bacteroidota bacterium]
MRMLIALAVLFSAAPPAFGGTDRDPEFDTRVRQGIEYVYNLEFEQAEREFAELVRLKPEHPAGPFFQAMVLWWRILIDIDNDRYDDRFHDALDGVVDLCDRILEKDERDVTALFFKGGAIGFKGRLNAHRSEWLAAANAGRKALPLVQTASALDPANYDIRLGSGIYNYYAEVVPREYPFVKPLLVFVPRGDKALGIRQLTDASERGKYADIEATYFLMQIYFQFEKNYPKAMDLALRLHTRFPRNPLFHRYLGRTSVSLGQWPQAEAAFDSVSARAQRAERGYGAAAEREAEYYLGLARMNRREFQPALVHFYRCDELSRTLDTEEPSAFMILTNLKVGMIYDLQEKRDLARKQYRKVLAMREYKDSYRQAEQYLKTPYVQ